MVVSAKNDDNKAAPPPRSNKASAAGANVGDALRAVYREAVAESIPDEMLDLLNKLG